MVLGDISGSWEVQMIVLMPEPMVDYSMLSLPAYQAVQNEDKPGQTYWLEWTDSLDNYAYIFKYFSEYCIDWT